MNTTIFKELNKPYPANQASRQRKRLDLKYGRQYPESLKEEQELYRKFKGAYTPLYNETKNCW